ncbi:hypothetical protein LCGC14_2708920 [marine sediment metagenome]|uniref:YprB ribonuclease H-like domain-containing protein n=1 Tax=marine sediment metagenome TaxID=412755 RepID=A0A0F8ZDJ5_9ZZZZ
MTTNYKGSLSDDEQLCIILLIGAGDSGRTIAEILSLPYGKVRGFMEWYGTALTDLLPPPTEGPAILIFDIENTAATGRFWGKKYKTNILKVIEDWYLLCVSYKWLGQDEIGFFSIWDDPQYTPGSSDDTYVARRIWKLLDQADIVIAHNGEAFDTKKCNTRFSVHQYGPPSPYQIIDTLREDRRYFNRTSHALGDVAVALGLSDKMKHSGYDLWEDCMAGDPEALATMEAYNRQDVVVLEELYLENRAWIGAPGKKAHPNLGHWSKREGLVCPTCGHDNLHIRGYHRTTVSEFPVYYCVKKTGGCGSYHRSRTRVPQRAPADKVKLV